MAKASKINHSLLSGIVSGAVTHVSQADGLPLLQHNPPLIEVNTAAIDAHGNAQVRATEHGHAMAKLNAPAVTEASGSKYAIITNAVLPEAKKRGNQSGSGAPTKYPFAELAVGGMFFSANSEHNKGDAVKALGSTVSSQNNKYSEPTGERKTVTRAVRDPKTHKAIVNTDGTKQTETVELDVKSYNRKFTIRPVVGGQAYGGWTAPEDGALIARVK